MQWHDRISEYIQQVKPVSLSEPVVQRIASLIDLTNLKETDTESEVAAFCEKAILPFGHVAAVCVYPQFTRLVADTFAGSEIKTATVVNFPGGNLPLESVLIEINQALEDGAQEIDVVFPYERYLAGERQYAKTFVETCKAACGVKAILKVILETGALKDSAIIADATFDVLSAGADFVKTSTGKITEGATLEAAAVMLLVIQHISPQMKHPIGLKVSGGIRTLEKAAEYVELADHIMGRDWVTPETFRIGASKIEMPSV
jgi:deoxyribose-phosphate aldolase